MKNYHTHTMRCMHAIGSEEEYILQAIKEGFTELGFSDHTPWRYDSSYIATMRMKEYQLKGYVNTLKKLKEKYKNEISIKIGLECEYFPKYMPWFQEMIKEYDLDYVILGHHFNETDEYGIYNGYSLTKEEFTQYINSCIEALKTGLYSYIAHPELGNYDTTDLFYKEEMKRLCKVAKDLNIPVEYNLLGLLEKRHYPNEVFLMVAKEVGCKVIIGCDAHAPNMINKNKFQQAQKYLQSLGLEITEDIKFLK